MDKIEEQVRVSAEAIRQSIELHKYYVILLVRAFESLADDQIASAIPWLTAYPITTENQRNRHIYRYLADMIWTMHHAHSEIYHASRIHFIRYVDKPDRPLVKHGSVEEVRQVITKRAEQLCIHTTRFCGITLRWEDTVSNPSSPFDTPSTTRASTPSRVDISNFSVERLMGGRELSRDELSIYREGRKLAWAGVVEKNKANVLSAAQEEVDKDAMIHLANSLDFYCELTQRGLSGKKQEMLDKLLQFAWELSAEHTRSLTNAAHDNFRRLANQSVIVPPKEPSLLERLLGSRRRDE
jgi:hypothetical protein